MHILIVEAPFYTHIADMQRDGVIDALKAAGATYEVITVPGALEVPAAIAFADASGQYDGYVALGCVIRGETYHFEVVSDRSAHGVMDVSLEYGVPIANAILTVDTDEQAHARTAEKGADAARVAIEMANLAASLATLTGDDEDDDA